LSGQGRPRPHSRPRRVSGRRRARRALGSELALDRRPRDRGLPRDTLPGGARMSASVHGEGDRQGLRLVLSFFLAMSLYEIVKYVFLLPPPPEQLPWSPTWLVTINDMVWPVVVLLVFAAIGVLGFARGKRAQLVFGLLALVCLAVLVEVLGAHVNQHRRRFYSVGAT